MFEILRSIYRRARSIPVLGTLIVALRHRQFPEFSTTNKRLAHQNALLEAHSFALAGVRQAQVIITQQAAELKYDVTHTQNLHRDLAQAHNDLHRDLGRIEDAIYKELYKQVHLINQRVEFVREETMYEIRHLTGNAGDGDAKTEIVSRIINEEKFAAQKEAGNIRLNVGCGHKPHDDRLNVDMRDLPGIDIVALVSNLPFEPDSVKEIYSSHVLEHFPEETLRRSVLPHWLSLLASGGEVRAIVPDADAMIRAFSEKKIDFENLRLITFGGQEYEGDFHHTMFSPESLSKLFADQGLTDITIVDRGRRNGLCLECEVVGRKA